MSLNADLIEQFKILQSYYRSKGDKGRTIAYGKCVASLRTVDKKITSISDLKGVRGIGQKITSKIKEYLDTGKIQTVEDKKKEIRKEVYVSKKDKAVTDFQTIWGVGPVKARTLYEAGMRSISDIQKNTELLNKQQRIGLKYYRDLQKRVPKKLITTMYIIFMYYLNKEYGKDTYNITIAGSYRRGATDSGDVDCLLTSKKFGLRDAVNILKKKGIITEILSMRDTKFMGIAHCPKGNGQYFRLDIEFVPEDEWGSALLYFTGSKGFNVYMRADAKRKGMLLNEHGLYNIKTGKKVLQEPTEEDIFQEIGIRYVPPERR